MSRETGNIGLQIVEVTSPAGELVEPEWLARAEPVHRELRPHLAEYAPGMRRVFAGGGRMLVAAKGDKVFGVAVYRVYENTAEGRHLYVDDLVTAEASRSGGVGHTLLARLEQRAGELGCSMIKLDSGTHRTRAHKFYFREGFSIVSFHFSKPIK